MTIDDEQRFSPPPSDESENSPEEPLPAARSAPPLALWILLILGLAAVSIGIRLLIVDAPNAPDPSAVRANSIYRFTSGDPAPDFTVRTLDGQTLSLKDIKGQIVMVNFWATWCPPCRSEMPDMERLYQERKDDGVQILAVNLQEAPEPVSRFVEQYNLTFPIVMDTSGEMSQLFGVQSLPTSFFIDKEGKISGFHVGSLNKSAIERRIAQALD